MFVNKQLKEGKLNPEDLTNPKNNTYLKYNTDDLSTLIYLRGLTWDFVNISKTTKEEKALILIQDDLKQRKTRIESIIIIQSALRGFSKRAKKKSIIIRKEVQDSLDLFVKENSKSLGLNSCSLKEIPQKVSDFATNIEILDVSKNLIQNISSWVCYTLVNVKIMNLSHNCLSKLPDEFKELKSIEELNLSFNQFEEFPQTILSLKLTKLDISFNLLECIPSNINSLKELNEIDISHNMLTKLPDEIQDLQNLKIAHIHENRPNDPDQFKEMEIQLNSFFRQRRNKRRVAAPPGNQINSSPEGKTGKKLNPLIKVLQDRIDGPKVPQTPIFPPPDKSEEELKDELSPKGMNSSDQLDAEFETPQNAIRKSMSSIPTQLLKSLSGVNAKDDEERAKVLQEIIDSETKYVNFLTIIMESYVKPIRAGIVSGKKQILSKQESATLFPPDLTSIFSFNTELLKDLKNNGPQIRSISETFIRMSPMFKLYIGYTKTYQNSLNEIRHFTKENKKFAEWCVNQKKKCGQGLSSLMVMPIQRIPRYRLLFESVLKVTPEEHPDYELLTTALDLIKKNAILQNKICDEYEKKLKVKELSEDLEIDDLVQPHRDYVHEVTVISKESSAKMYLFNDILIINFLSDPEDNMMMLSAPMLRHDLKEVEVIDHFFYVALFYDENEKVEHDEKVMNLKLGSGYSRYSFDTIEKKLEMEKLIKEYTEKRSKMII
eukprot:gene3754-6642_t